MIPLGTYAFQDIQASLVGPGASLQIGGSGNAEEAVSIEAVEEKDAMTIGADGSGMHSLKATKGGRILVRVLKTSPLNGQLAQAYNFQTSSSLNHGKNTFSLADSVRGDSYNCQGVAFARMPSNAYAKEAGLIEWELLAVSIDFTLSNGQ